jgi:hypothetical protein
MDLSADEVELLLRGDSHREIESLADKIGQDQVLPTDANFRDVEQTDNDASAAQYCRQLPTSTPQGYSGEVRSCGNYLEPEKVLDRRPLLPDESVQQKSDALSRYASDASIGYSQ